MLIYLYEIELQTSLQCDTSEFNTRQSPSLDPDCLSFMQIEKIKSLMGLNLIRCATTSQLHKKNSQVPIILSELLLK